MSDNVCVECAEPISLELDEVVEVGMGLAHVECVNTEED